MAVKLVMECGFNFQDIFFFNVAEKKERKSLSKGSKAQIWCVFHFFSIELQCTVVHHLFSLKKEIPWKKQQCISGIWTSLTLKWLFGFRLEPLFATSPAVCKSTTCFKSAQKCSKVLKSTQKCSNYHLASYSLIS